MKIADIAKFFGLTIEETKNVLKKYKDCFPEESSLKTLVTLHTDNGTGEIEVLDLPCYGYHRYFDDKQQEYCIEYYTESLIRADEAIDVYVYSSQFGSDYSIKKTCQDVLNFYEIKKCSVCGNYECQEGWISDKNKLIKEYNGVYYCPDHLPKGTKVCQCCGKVVREENIRKIYDTDFSHSVCLDCLNELVDDLVVAKCADGKYYKGYGRYNGQLYPYEVYAALKFGEDAPDWWHIGNERIDW